MDSLDEAVRTALCKYQEYYPSGVLPREIEDKAILSVGVEGDFYIVDIHFWLRNAENPFCFFRAQVHKKTGMVTVTVAHDPSTVSVNNLIMDAQDRMLVS